MRYIILLASALVHACIGGLYAWSSFVPGLTGGYGLSTAQTQLIFGSLVLVFTFFMVVAGRLMGRLGPRLITVTGGILLGSGYWLASRSSGNFGVLLVGVSGLVGTGTGFCYVGPLAMSARWFPRRKGMATGITVSGFGAGAIFLAFFAERMLDGGLDVLAVFARIGLLYAGVILVSALPFRLPDGPGGRADHLDFKVITRDRYFRGLFCGIFAGTFAGLLVIGNLSPLILSRGIAPAAAAISISVFAAGNAAGRVLWGWLSDRLKDTAIPLSLALLAASITLAIFLPSSPAGAIILSALIGLGFGACFVVYAARVGSHFGTDHVASIYPLVFLGYGISGLFGPWAGGLIYDITGSYRGGLIIAIVVVISGLALSRRLLSGGEPANRETGCHGKAPGELR